MNEKDKAIPAIINSLLMGQEGPMTATQQVGRDGKPLPPPPRKNSSCGAGDLVTCDLV
jgi:hypothetical protein